MDVEWKRTDRQRQLLCAFPCPPSVHVDTHNMEEVFSLATYYAPEGMRIRLLTTLGKKSVQCSCYHDDHFYFFARSCGLALV